MDVGLFCRYHWPNQGCPHCPPRCSGRGITADDGRGGGDRDPQGGQGHGWRNGWRHGRRNGWNVLAVVVVTQPAMLVVYGDYCATFFQPASYCHRQISPESTIQSILYQQVLCCVCEKKCYLTNVGKMSRFVRGCILHNVPVWRQQLQSLVWGYQLKLAHVQGVPVDLSARILVMYREEYLSNSALCQG